MAQDRPPAPPFPRDEVDPKTTIGSARDQQPYVEYFARAPPESGTKGTWPAPEAFEAAPKPPAPWPRARCSPSFQTSPRAWCPWISARWPSRDIWVV